VKVDVRFFASLKDVTGCPGFALTLPDGTDFEGLCGALDQRLGAAALTALRAASVRVARNQTLEDPPFQLNDGDEIAFLPPVTGG